jgi:predicted nucleic acid-binding protein
MTGLLVDTSVWVDFFRARAAPHVTRLEKALSDGQDVCICGVILTEVLQGIRSDRDYRRTSARFDPLLFLSMDRETFVAAADLYRTLRRRGLTVRKPVDCMIAAVAISYDVELLHNDRDFEPMQEHCGLRVAELAGTTT